LHRTDAITVSLGQVRISRIRFPPSDFPTEIPDFSGGMLDFEDAVWNPRDFGHESVLPVLFAGRLNKGR
jgi:hypothetical protein